MKFWRRQTSHDIVRDGVAAVFPRLWRYSLTLTGKPEGADDFPQQVKDGKTWRDINFAVAQVAVLANDVLVTLDLLCEGDVPVIGGCLVYKATAVGVYIALRLVSFGINKTVVCFWPSRAFN